MQREGRGAAPARGGQRVEVGRAARVADEAQRAPAAATAAQASVIAVVGDAQQDAPRPVAGLLERLVAPGQRDLEAGALGRGGERAAHACRGPTTDQRRSRRVQAAELGRSDPVPVPASEIPDGWSVVDEVLVLGRWSAPLRVAAAGCIESGPGHPASWVAPNRRYLRPAARTVVDPNYIDPVPIYEFRCGSCGDRFEELVARTSARPREVAVPSAAAEAERLLSASCAPLQRR